MQVNIPCTGRVIASCFTTGDFDMPHHGAGFTKEETHCGAEQNDTYLNYETALLECASGSQSAVGKIYARDKNQLRALAYRIVHDRSCGEDVILDAFVPILLDVKNFDPA